MQMKKRALALITAVIFALMLIPGISFASEMSADLRAAYDALEIPNADNIRGSITLPKTGENGATVSWTSSDESVVSTTEIENEGYVPTPAGVVTRGSEDVNVTLKAEISLGGETAEKTFELTVKASPDSAVSLMDADEEEPDKYLMYYFKGDYNDNERIWVAASEDGLNWTPLNGDEPILSSSLGTGGLRDPYVIRSHEGDKYFLIATDLKVADMGWGENSRNGSKSVMIWETTDLTDWGEQREVEVSTLEGMGCTWAPEAAYDDTTDEYVMYWASRVGDYYSVYSARTRDFITFSEPVEFVVRDPNSGNEKDNVIDTTIIKTDSGYYRFTKNENSDQKRVFMEFSEELTGTYENINTNIYDDEAGVEGPEIYQLPDSSYCLILDRYSQGGYFPFTAASLEPNEDNRVTFTALDTSSYSFPSSPRHGTVVRVPAKEYDKVVNYYNGDAEAVAPDEDGSGPIVVYNFDDGTAADGSGNGNNGTLMGDAEIVTDATKGSVLSLDGSTGTYLELPRGVLDGRNELTVSMDVRNVSTGNFFTFALGKNSTRYLFSRLRPDSVRTAMTVQSYGSEYGAETSIPDCGNIWTNLTFTISAADGKIKTYLDGVLVAEADTDITVSGLGLDTFSYIGKSFFSSDSYANMRVDNVEIYNRTLSASEIAEKYGFSRYSMTIDADERGVDISDSLFGLFFEDINYAADGGLYSEVINNRSFEAYNAYTAKDGTADPIPLYGWSAVNSAEIDSVSYNPLNANNPTYNPLNANNPTYLKLTANAAGDGIANDCYGGFSARTGAKYNASLYARGDYAGEIAIRVLDSDGNVIGESSVSGIGEDFAKYETELEIVGESCATANIQLLLSEEGAVELDMISVIPQQTFNGRDNGLRADLVEKLAELNPGFLRFPGGCIVEGYTLDNRYQWKDTVGPVEQRTQNWNRWQTHNEYHDGNGMYGYCQTYGLGFYEYFLLCEDIGADAVPVVNVGLSCQYQAKEYSTYDELYEIYIQDALDLIEFANGEPDSDWDAIDYSAVDTSNPKTFNDNWANLRALMGHPEAFGLKYIGVGNEQWDTSDYSSVDENGWATSGNNFFRRYELFEEEIHKLYPDMRLIGTSGPSSDGTDFTNAWTWLKSHNGEDGFTYAVDEHYYKDPDWFYGNVNRYDTYDRGGFDVFAGEYASRWYSDYPRGNTLETALSEAAFMTGLEKNADVVKMASYAPLFAKLGSTQWTPDMIWFDTDTVYGSADYYVQKLYSNNSGDFNLSESIDDIYEEAPDYSGVTGVGTWLTSANFSDFTVTDNVTGEDLTPSAWRLGETNEIEKYEYTVTASDEPESANPKENVQDGDLNTRWTSNGKGNWLLCDLGDIKTVGKIGVATYAVEDREYYYEIQISSDGENYTSIFDGTNGTNAGDIVYTLAGNQEARYIKLILNGNSYHNWNGVTEVEIYGECPQSDFESTGTWSEDENGILTQSDESCEGAYLFADESIESNDYTITVKATKTGGAEGFLIPVMASDRNNLIHWNVGGWGNTLSTFEVRSNGSNSGGVGTATATVLETGREYELKVVVSNGAVYGYIDGELISTYTFDATSGPVYGNSTFDEETGDIIVKLINSSSIDKLISVSIAYSGALTGYATEYLLTGDALSDKNSIDDPENISVTASEIDGIDTDFTYSLPAYSFVVLRVHTGGTKAVAQVGDVSVATKVGNLPALPSTVDVVLSDGTLEQRAVEWRLPTAGTFINPGTFKVYGDIEGTEVDAVATVVAVSVSGDEIPEDIISVDEASLLSGEVARIYFNPGVEGEYIGILAVYENEVLVSAQTFSFTESSYWDIVKPLDTENKEIKIMLWTGDGFAPFTEAAVIKNNKTEE